MENIRKLLESDISTARGRNLANKSAIEIKDCTNDKYADAYSRIDRYVGIKQILKQSVSENHRGISDEELESAEFVLEQLDSLAKMAFNTMMENGR